MFFGYPPSTLLSALLGGGADVAPSLRLMVVGLGGASVPSPLPTSPMDPLTPLMPPITTTPNKKLTPLHLVTKDGAVLGRLSKNGVYLPHISISKVRVKDRAAPLIYLLPEILQFTVIHTNLSNKFLVALFI